MNLSNFYSIYVWQVLSFFSPYIFDCKILSFFSRKDLKGPCNRTWVMESSLPQEESHILYTWAMITDQFSKKDPSLEKVHSQQMTIFWAQVGFILQANKNYISLNHLPSLNVPSQTVCSVSISSDCNHLGKKSHLLPNVEKNFSLI